MLVNSVFESFKRWRVPKISYHPYSAEINDQSQHSSPDEINLDIFTQIVENNKELWAEDFDARALPSGISAKRIEVNDPRLVALREHFQTHFPDPGDEVGSIGNSEVKFSDTSIYRHLIELTNEYFGPTLDRIYKAGHWKLRTCLHHFSNEFTCPQTFTYGDSCVAASDLRFVHVDTTPPNQFKAMLYLSDNVSIDNGAFQYVPYSYHHAFDRDEWAIRKAVREYFVNTDVKALSTFLQLPREYQKRNTFLYLQDFESNSKYINRIKNGLKLYESPQNFILFNPFGYHTGGFVRSGERRALQLVFCPGDA